jgi:hypothetical protein
MDEDRRENRDQVEGQRGKIRWEETELKSSELTAGAVSELATMRMDGGDVAMSLPYMGNASWRDPHCLRFCLLQQRPDNSGFWLEAIPSLGRAGGVNIPTMCLSVTTPLLVLKHLMAFSLGIQPPAPS